MGSFLSSETPDISEEVCRRAFFASAASGRGVHRLSFVLLESVCGYLSLVDHCRFAEVSKAWLGVARSGSPRSWPPNVRVTIGDDHCLRCVIKARCVFRDCVLGAVDEATVASFAATFPSLTNLSIGVPRSGWLRGLTGAWVDAVAKLTGLQELSIAGPIRLDDDHETVTGLSRLSGLRLRKLRLRNLVIEEAVLPAFADSGMPLQSLDLSAQLGLECEAGVARLPLTQLQLQDAAEVPRRLPPSLERVTISALPNKQLDGVDRLPSLLRDTVVSDLRFWFAELTAEWWTSLGAFAGDQLRSLSLISCGSFRREELAALSSGLRALEKLELLSQPELTDEDMQLFQQLPSLLELSVDSKLVTPAALPFFAQTRTLQQLSVSFHKQEQELTWVHLAPLAGVLSLRSVSLSCDGGVRVSSDVSNKAIKRVFEKRRPSCPVQVYIWR